jgi:N-methylhydantoinase A/oxoprolinase/acetone carboxylase beta subunit
MLEADLADSEGGSMHGKFVLKPFGDMAGGLPSELSAREAEILALVSERPRPIRKIAVSSAAQRALAALKRRGLVQTGGFTPSDAAHVLGLQHNWPGPAARIAAKLLVRSIDMKAGDEARTDDFCRQVWSETVRRTARVILDTAFGKSFGEHELVDSVCSGRGELGLVKVSLAPVVPVVAVGGPVKVYYEEVGRRLSSEVVFPPFFEVANAVGAASGVIAQSVVVVVEGNGSGTFRVHGPAGVEIFASGSEALAAAERLAGQSASDAVVRLGGRNPQAKISMKKIYLPDSVDENGLLEASVRAEAIGRPETS